MAIFSAISSVIGSKSAKKAAKVQASAATLASIGINRSAEIAAASQLEAARIGSATQLQMFEQSRQDIAPWRETGTRALAQLESMFITPGGIDTQPDFAANFTESPGYQFRLSEGIRARDRSASARGRLASGGHQRALIRYGQGVASNEFGQYYDRERDRFNTYANRLSGLAGLGQASAVQTGQLGQQAAATAGQIGLRGAAGAGNQLMRGAAGAGRALQAAGTARASGYIGSANAITSGISSGVNNAMFLYGMGMGGGGMGGMGMGRGGGQAGYVPRQDRGWWG